MDCKIDSIYEKDYAEKANSGVQDLKVSIEDTHREIK